VATAKYEWPHTPTKVPAASGKVAAGIAARGIRPPVQKPPALGMERIAPLVPPGTLLR